MTWLLRLLSPLDRKLARDLWAMKGQALAIACVIAGGVSVFLISAGMLDSLTETRRAYYERYRFADIWAPVVRAPDALAADIRRIEGVQAAETRIRAPLLFDIPGMSEPASGEAISLPDGREPLVNQLYLMEGRLPRPGQRGEAVVIDSFAAAHGLEIGDTLSATIRGGRSELTVVGRALSPEHVYTIAPGQIVPDPRLYGVIWMSRDALGEAVDQDGAFNEAVVRLMPGHDAAPVIDRLDRLLDPYGAPGAYGREDQISDAFVSSEIDQLSTMGRILPPIFLAVAAFLVNVVLSRLVATERAEIGLMKAFGYRDRDVMAHYLKFAGLIGVLGLAIGGGAGIWLGRLMAGLYTDYYHFPFLVFTANPRVYLLAFAITVVAVGGGAILAARRAAALHPAVAMQPPPPPDYSRTAGMGLTRWTLLDQPSRMILRRMARWPGRAGFTLAGVAMSGALLVGTLYFTDAMEAMVSSYFDQSNRQDVTVSFVEPRQRSAFHEVSRLPGVLAAEPFRSVAVRLRYGPAEERAAMMGVPRGAALSRMIGADGQGVETPPGGLVVSRDLAQTLGVEAGDRIAIEITEGRRPILELPVAAVVTTLIGSGVQMELGDLNALMGEGAVVSGAHLVADADAVDRLYTALKSAPGVAGVSLQSVAERNFRALMDESMGVAIWLYTGFAGLIAIGVIYNSVRISLSESAHEFATLRVLGFTRAEVSYILLGEIGFLTLIALPAGGLLGTGLAWYFADAMSSDLFRLPFVIHPATYGFAAAVILVTTALSGLIVRARLDHLDLVAVLKARE